MLTINLNKQVQIYSVDTSFFYNEKENRVYNILNRRYIKKNQYKNLLQESEKEFNQELIAYYKNKISKSNKKIEYLKNILRQLFIENKDVRHLNAERLQVKNIISIFDSVLSRTLKMETNELSYDILVVQTFFFEIFNDIVNNGFIFNNEKYIIFTASAGQIRTKKTVFIKESVFEKHKMSLMCGLSIEKINGSKEKGMNINKFLAYLALNNSATEEWTNFDIKKSIVVEDFETNVQSMVDYIDKNSYQITRKLMDVPIAHTDGCGMILPSVSKKAFMVRLPWVKGLLVPFDFKKFSDISNNKIIKDIYGIEHDIEKEKIEIIFTKSQFKMWKYYKNWKDYQKNFKKYGCQAGKCNEEPDFFPDAKLTYQMLQTLNEMTTSELQILSNRTIETINAIGRDKEETLKVFGITEDTENLNPFQSAINTYPELLRDNYTKQVIKDIKKSLIKKARSGKLEISGKYSFIVPDLYAFCQKLFLGQEYPAGLLENGEISCKLFNDNEELDVLRSPHLFREHAIRKNKVNDKINEWFITNVMYISIKDPITKIIQADVDGDTCLISNEPVLVECAKRMTQDLVPLYYEMAVAGKEKLNNQNLYAGMIASYTGGNIGEISNNISKIWNSEEPDLEVIKWLTMENNFVIDYAKTLFKLETPANKEELIKKFTKQKLPHFFIFAKDKDKKQVQELNNSVMNRLYKLIPNNNIKFTNMDLGTFDYKMLMRNKNFKMEEDSKIKLNQQIVQVYSELNSKKYLYELKKNNLHVYNNIRKELMNTYKDEIYLTDVLVDFLYREKPNSNKETLWKCFGSTILRNIRRNSGLCEECGVVIENRKQKQFYCESCAKKIKNELNKKYYAEKSKKHQK